MTNMTVVSPMIHDHVPYQCPVCLRDMNVPPVFHLPSFKALRLPVYPFLSLRLSYNIERSVCQKLSTACNPLVSNKYSWLHHVQPDSMTESRI
jgi:hypothetical protein